MNTKIALFSDIHGNTTAFDAVIADSKKENIDEYWILGDVIMHGSGSTEIFDRIYDLNPTVWVKGNWDDLFLYIYSKKEIDMNDPSDVFIAKLGIDLLSKMSEKNISDLKNLPLNVVKTINGLTISISHNLPNKNYGRDLLPTEKQENFDALFESPDIDMAIYGHIHHQMLKYSSSEQLIINPGSVGYPFCFNKNLRKKGYSQYVILEINSEGVPQVNFKQVEYDVNHEIETAINSKLPYIEVYKKLLVEGTSKVHDNDFLKEIELKHNYCAEVLDYISCKNN